MSAKYQSLITIACLSVVLSIKESSYFGSQLSHRSPFCEETTVMLWCVTEALQPKGMAFSPHPKRQVDGG